MTSSFFPNIPASPAVTCISSWLYVIPDFFWAFIHTHTHVYMMPRCLGFFCFYISWIKLTIPPYSFPPITVYLEHFFHDRIYEAHVSVVALFF